ncbi:oxidoreductase [Trinickia dinghuensis]|uniref:Oxidoreductase n=1 Tax=Trinickia dinghuensis TaxID=2291023 RepID=A0A3D8JZE9_9BURK|nr:oxidoreductase [Trinickia dinghuensis]RDU98428.1 oxidoreductase [Trinickia dinghuensis]
MASTLKIGLMGYGFAGATFHAPVIDHCGAPAGAPDTPYARVAAIATSQPDHALADYPNAQIVADLDGLIASRNVECIVIATPNDTHYALAAKVLAAGKHVVVDKPVTLTSEESRTLARLAWEHGVLFAPFHNRRWDGDFMTLRELIESGTLGRVVHFESHFDRFRPQVRQRWREEALRGGGLLFDLGPHLIDQALTLFGAPESVFATVKQHRDQASAPDYVHLLLGYADKEVVLHASALTAIEPPRFIVHGTRGSYVKAGLDTQEDQLKAGLRPGQAGFGGGNAAGTLRALEGEREVERAVPTRDGAYVEFYRAVADAIARGTPFPVSAQDAVDVMTIIELANESAAEGKRLPFVRVPA